MYVLCALTELEVMFTKAVGFDAVSFIQKIGSLSGPH